MTRLPRGLRGRGLFLKKKKRKKEEKKTQILPFPPPKTCCVTVSPRRHPGAASLNERYTTYSEWQDKDRVTMFVVTRDSDAARHR